MRDLSHIDLMPGDFTSLAEMCRFDIHFPADFAEWTSLVEAAGRQATAMAIDNEPMALNPDAFKVWCATVEIVPCLDALRAYAIVCRRRGAARPA